MLGRTYLYPFMRFATPDPARDGWSLYAYTGNNPVNRVDPTGLYTVSCSTGDDCSDAAAKFESARQANLKRSDDIRATSLAYGEPGDANGVVVTFGASKPGAAANVVASVNYDQNSGYSLAATVTIDPSLSGAVLEAAVGHEGQHVADAQAFFATVTPSGYYDLSLNLKSPQLETNAFWISHAILRASNTPKRYEGPRGHLVTLGLRKLTNGEVAKRIEKIVNGPLYEGKQDKRQIFGYDVQQ